MRRYVFVRRHNERPLAVGMTTKLGYESGMAGQYMASHFATGDAAVFTTYGCARAWVLGHEWRAPP